MRRPSVVLATCALMMLSGCVASKIVTAPFRAAGTVVETAVDATTQSRSEREEDLGRRVQAERKREMEACLTDTENKKERKRCRQAYQED
ncbi:MAG: DUF6726 family protein [Parasphingorhabdus sp.]|uniref:DUF6726 family protein n=1 Tax=Parasphingorhabdus sp. TaxID=2709688 RepID=UPI003001F819